MLNARQRAMIKFEDRMADYIKSVEKFYKLNHDEALEFALEHNTMIWAEIYRAEVLLDSPRAK